MGRVRRYLERPEDPDPVSTSGPGPPPGLGGAVRWCVRHCVSPPIGTSAAPRVGVEFEYPSRLDVSPVTRTAEGEIYFRTVTRRYYVEKEKTNKSLQIPLFNFPTYLRHLKNGEG